MATANLKFFFLPNCWIFFLYPQRFGILKRFTEDIVDFVDLLGHHSKSRLTAGQTHTINNPFSTTANDSDLLLKFFFTNNY